MTDVRAAETALRDAASAAVGARDATAACGVVDTAVSDATPLAAARSALRHLAALLDALPEDGNALLEAVALHTVEALRPRVASLEDADYRFRQLLWQVYWGAEDYLRAGGALAPAHVDSAALALSDAERSSAFLRVAQAYLKADDDVSAERFIQRAAEWVHKSGVPWGVLVQYKTAWAQVLDAKRRFLEAALRYIEIARMPVEQLDAKELLVMLERATRCAVLAPAGPPRARVMAALVRDERIGEIDPRTLSMLQNMFAERLISANDASLFEATLLPHQRATGADGSTVLARAVQEHNVLAAARVYTNVSFASLGVILGVPQAKAERIAARMVLEKRLAATIDQVDGFLDFAAVQGGRATAFGGAAAGADATDSADVTTLLAWDAATKDVCVHVNALVERIAKAQRPQGGGARAGTS